MRPRASLALFVLLWGMSLPAWGEEPDDPFVPLAPPALGDEERAKLENDGVLVRSLPTADGRGMGVEAIGLVSALPAPVWHVMADCDRQDEFIPRVASATVRDREGDSHTCDLVIDLPFPVEDSRSASRNHVRRLPDGGYQRYWSLLPGDWSYERNRGSWTVHPYEGERSLLVNRMDLLPKSILPIWVLEAAQAQQAPDAFDAIRERVKTHGLPAVE